MKSNGRRQFLGKALLGTLGLPLLSEPAQALVSKLNPADPAAAAVGYVEDATKVDVSKFPTYKRGQSCANCTLLRPQYIGPYRPCKLFPKNVISVKGWCNAWVKNPQL